MLSSSARQAVAADTLARLLDWPSGLTRMSLTTACPACRCACCCVQTSGSGAQTMAIAGAATAAVLAVVGVAVTVLVGRKRK